MQLAQGPEAVAEDQRALTHPHLPDPETHRRVVGYLRHAPRLSSRFQTDGAWVWPAGLADDTAARGFGPPAQLLDHLTDRGYLLPDVLSDTGLDTAVDRALGRPTTQPPVAVRYLVDRSREPTSVIRVRPGAVGGAAVEAFTPRGWRRTPGVPATFRPASAATVLSYLDSLAGRWRSDQLARDLESAPPPTGPRVARLFDATDAADRPRFSPARRRIVERQRRERVAQYLGAGRLVIRSTSRMADPLGDPGAMVPLGFRTDGHWVWPEGLAHYVRTRGVAPELALLSHIEERAYQPAVVADAQVGAAVEAVRRGAPPVPVRTSFGYLLDPTEGRLMRAPREPAGAPFDLEVMEPDLRWNPLVGLDAPRPGGLTEITEEQATRLLDERWVAADASG